jgi:hypothetical protein
MQKSNKITHSFPRKTATIWNFSSLRQESLSGILLQRGIAILDCKAAALPGRFLPELGRSPSGHFFALSFWAVAVLPRRSRAKPASLAALGYVPKVLAQNRAQLSEITPLPLAGRHGG